MKKVFLPNRALRKELKIQEIVCAFHKWWHETSFLFLLAQLHRQWHSNDAKKLYNKFYIIFPA